MSFISLTLEKAAILGSCRPWCRPPGIGPCRRPPRRSRLQSESSCPQQSPSGQMPVLLGPMHTWQKRITFLDFEREINIFFVTDIAWSSSPILILDIAEYPSWHLSVVTSGASADATEPRLEGGSIPTENPNPTAVAPLGNLKGRSSPLSPKGRQIALIRGVRVTVLSRVTRGGRSLTRRW